MDDNDNRMYFQFKIHTPWGSHLSPYFLAQDEKDAHKQLGLAPGTKAELHRTIPRSKLTGPLDAASHALPR